MIRRSVTVVTIAAALVLTGCAPEPDPTPTPTGFATEEEAFAAAEATYRAYVDALNARRAGLQDPDPTGFLTGDALKTDTDGQAMLATEGLRVEGNSTISSVTHDSVLPSKITIAVCMDATDTRVINALGEDVTPPDREPVGSLTIELIGTPERLLISRTSVGTIPC